MYGGISAVLITGDTPENWIPLLIETTTFDCNLALRCQGMSVRVQYSGRSNRDILPRIPGYVADVQRFVAYTTLNGVD